MSAHNGKLLEEVLLLAYEVPSEAIARKCKAEWPRELLPELIGLLRLMAQQYATSHPQKSLALDLIVGHLEAEPDP